MPNKTKNNNIVSLLLRFGLAFVFLYAAVSSLQQPIVWAAYLPNFLTRSVSSTLLIKMFAVYELILAVWLITGRYTRYAAAFCTLTLVGIVATGPSQFMTTFRDVGLAFMAAALYFTQD